LRCLYIAQVGQPHEIQQCLGLFPQRSLPAKEPRRPKERVESAVPFVEVTARYDILQDGHVGENLHVLKRPCDPGPGNLIGEQAGELPISEKNISSVGAIEARDHIEERGLACPVRADHRMEGSLPDRITYLPKGGDATKMEVDFLPPEVDLAFGETGHGLALSLPGRGTIFETRIFLSAPPIARKPLASPPGRNMMPRTRMAP